MNSGDFRRLQKDHDIGAVISKFPPIAPGLTRAEQATERAWRKIEQEFRMLNSLEVATLVGLAPNRYVASAMRKRGQIIGTKRLNRYLYPSFQFAADCSVKPVFASLSRATADSDWSDSDLILWLCAPSGTFRGDRPVDHLEDLDFVILVTRTLSTDW